MRWKLFKPKYHKIGLKYGLAGTAAASAATGAVAYLAAPLGEKESTAYEGAKLAAKAGLGLTGAFLLRKHIVRAAAAGGKTLGRSVKHDAGVMFRRIGGRIIPIRRKV